MPAIATPSDEPRLETLCDSPEISPSPFSGNPDCKTLTGAVCHYLSAPSGAEIMFPIRSGSHRFEHREITSSSSPRRTLVRKASRIHETEYLVFRYGGHSRDTISATVIEVVQTILFYSTRHENDIIDGARALIWSLRLQ